MEKENNRLQNLIELEKLNQTISFLEERVEEFKILTKEFENCQNETISQIVRAEGLYIQADNKAHELSELSVKFKKIKEKISQYPDLEELNDRILKIEPSFISPTLRIQKIYLDKKLNKALKVRNKGIPIATRTRIGSKKTSPFIF